MIEGLGLCAAFGFVGTVGGVLLMANADFFVLHGALLPWDKYVAVMPMLLRSGGVMALLVPFIAVNWEHTCAASGQRQRTGRSPSRALK
jgi:hypothetical protein